jgi:hypothetical protein
MMADGSFYLGDMREDSVEGLGVYRNATTGLVYEGELRLDRQVCARAFRGAPHELRSGPEERRGPRARALTRARPDARAPWQDGTGVLWARHGPAYFGEWLEGLRHGRGAMGRSSPLWKKDLRGADAVREPAGAPAPQTALLDTTLRVQGVAEQTSAGPDCNRRLQGPEASGPEHSISKPRLVAGECAAPQGRGAEGERLGVESHLQLPHSRLEAGVMWEDLVAVRANTWHPALLFPPACGPAASSPVRVPAMIRHQRLLLFESLP